MRVMLKVTTCHKRCQIFIKPNTKLKCTLNSFRLHSNTYFADRNDSLHQELQTMKNLICVVAPQHYIDDDNAGLDFNKGSLEASYEFISAAHHQHNQRNQQYESVPVRKVGVEQEVLCYNCFSATSAKLLQF